MLRLIALLLVVGLLSSPLWLAMLALDPLPRVVDAASLSVDDIENAKRLLRENDPRRLRDGEQRRTVLTERELNLLLTYGLPVGSNARVAVSSGLMTLVTSSRVPSTPFGSYVNLQVILVEQGPVLVPMSLIIGNTTVPGWMAGGLVKAGNAVVKSWLPEYGSLLDSLDSVEAEEGRVAVTYRWQRDLMVKLRDRGRDLLLPESQRESILAYYLVLAAQAPTLSRGASLDQVMGPLFSLAASRTDAGRNAADEHRALLLALALALQGGDVSRLNTDPNVAVPRIRRLNATLRGRRDLAQHFVVSAGLTAGGGSRLADAVGVFKELSDSRGGSGFSFPDLLADRAGVVFAERITSSGAREMQRRLASGIDESAFMPPIAQLPEGLQDLEFRDRYEDLDSQAYAQVKAEVERRISALALYR